MSPLLNEEEKVEERKRFGGNFISWYYAYFYLSLRFKLVEMKSFNHQSNLFNNEVQFNGNCENSTKQIINIKGSEALYK